jgi:hypothetical protein
MKKPLPVAGNERLGASTRFGGTTQHRILHRGCSHDDVGLGLPREQGTVC